MRSKISFLLGLLVCGVFPSARAFAQDVAALELRARGEQQLEAFVTQVQSLRGRFLQTVMNADGAVEDEYEGTLAIARPGRFRWVYTDPYEQILVADGRNLWNYDVDLDQVSVTAQQAALGQSPAAVLSGTGAALETLDVQGAFEADGLLWVQMAVTDLQSDFKALRFGFDIESNLLAGMQITDSLGQLTIISFRDLEINVALPDSLFDFAPPAGIDVIGEPVPAESKPPESSSEDSQLPVAGFG